MTEKMSQLINWCVTDIDRAKAQSKYELNYLKSSLHRYLQHPAYLTRDADAIIELCRAIADKYMDYLLLLDNSIELNFPELSSVPCPPEYFNSIFNLEQKLAQSHSIETQKNLIIEILALYKRISSLSLLDAAQQAGEYSNCLKQLFAKPQLELWLIGLIDFWNQHETSNPEFVALFQDWNVAQQKLALNFFADHNFIDLVNAIFFYKLYPERLFTQSVHPEKLISIRTRLGILHYYIELMQQQLYDASQKNGLNPGIDYLLHGDNLPRGIMLEVDERYRKVIQTSIKKLKVYFSPQNHKQEILELLHDLGRAYKFWFNPNRLIDTVMLLQQRTNSDASKREDFQVQIMLLFNQLTTNECLDLYGYFANNDSRYLLYAFFAITQGITFDWLPSLNERDKAAVEKVFHALSDVMDALRIELKNRHVLTDPYMYQVNKHRVHIGHRNRDAVLRAMILYGQSEEEHSEFTDHLFRIMEEN
jgi:hypothetical protein